MSSTTKWGRWIATSSSRDGEGERRRPKGAIWSGGPNREANAPAGAGPLRAHFTTRERAQDLRRNLTKAEAVLRTRLRAHQVFNCQFRKPHPIGPYIADFACSAAKLVVEVDGETHSTAEERAYDARRSAFMESEGWTVIRFWNSEVYTNLHGVVETIRDALFAALEGVEPER